VDGRTVRAGDYAKRRLAEKRFADLAAGSKKLTLPLERLWVENEGQNSYVRVLQPAGIAPPGTEGNLLIGTNGLVRCVDALHYRPLWHKRINGIVTRPVFSEGNLILVNSAGILAVDPDSGAKRWETPNDASLRAVATSSGQVFVMTADFHRPRDLLLRCISPRNGEILWKREIEDHQIYDVLFIAEEAIGIASLDPAGVSVFDTTTGRLRYRIAMKPRTLGRVPRILDGDKLVIVKGSRQVAVHDLPTGGLLWTHNLPTGRLFNVGIPTTSGYVYFNNRDEILCLENGSGKVRWTVPPEKGTTLVADGDNGDSRHVYTIRKREEDEAYFVTARNIQTGKIVWRREILKSRNANFSTVVADQYLLANVNSFDFGLNAWTSKTYVLDLDDGRTVQEIKVDEMQGFYANVRLYHGLLTFNARGRVGVYGPK
jgi:outer membrane protein assembly factor BamB